MDIFDTPIPSIEAIGFFDIDFFKQFNTDHGHHTGDMVLKHVAHIIKREAKRLGGKAFRYGGEEFVATFSKSMSHEEIDSIRKSVEDSICMFE